MTNYTDYFGQTIAQSGGVKNWLSAKAANTLLSGSTTNDQLSDAGLATTLSGSAGDDTYFVGVTSNIPGQTLTIVSEDAGGGVDTVIDYADYTLAANVENLSVIGAHTAVGNGLNNLILGDATSRQTLDGGAGDDVLVGGGGMTYFRFESGSGHDAIYGFTPSGAAPDVIQLGDYGFTSFSAVSAAMTQKGADVVLQLDANDAVLIKNTTVASLSADNFLLAMNTKALAGLKPAFAEEFDTLSLYDRATGEGVWKTNFWYGAQEDGLSWSDSSRNPHDGEQQIYVDPAFAGSGKTALGINPFSVQNGVVAISANPTPAQDQSALWSYKYTSGLLTTETSFAQQYGYFEVRAELPEGKGMWPAFWLSPVGGGWPPELDIFEHLGGETLYQTSHSGIGGANVEQANAVYMSDLTTGFHTFGALWTAEKITWYVDGVATFSTATPADMDKSMFIQLNLAIGGNFPGNADATTQFPANLKIDYVHVYSMEQMNSIGMGAPVQTFTGTSGNDTFVVDNGADKIVEAANGGTDTVKAAVSYSLGDNVENLTLTGTSASNATGNSLANVIIGNSGDNVITGGAGADTLSGGGGADTFVFNLKGGRDVVTDFDAHDTLDLTAYSRMGYTPTLTNSGDDLLISFRNGDVIQLTGVHASDVRYDGQGHIFHF